jgi:hypothetical protein
MSLRAEGEAISLTLEEIATSPFGLLAMTNLFFTFNDQIFHSLPFGGATQFLSMLCLLILLLDWL